MFFDYFSGESLLIPKFALKIGGIWPLDKTKRGSLVAFVICSALKIANTITALIDNHQNLRPGMDALVLCTIQFSAFLATLLIRINSDRLVRLIELKINDWSPLTNPKEREIMKRNKIFGASFFVVSILNSFVLSTVRLIWFFPFHGNYTLSVQQHTAINDHYTRLSATAVFHRVALLYSAFVGYGTLMLFWSLNTHLTGQFKMLKRHFQQFLRIKNKDKGQRKFRRLVDRHNQLLSLSDDLENSFSGFLAMEVLIHQVFICYHAYQLALAKLNDNPMELANAVQTIAYNAWLLFVIYYSGECLTTCSEEIGDVFRECKWYNLSKDSRINFSIVILQSRRPKKLTAAGLFRLTLSNYKYMAQSVYSYISLILAITKK